MTDAPMTTPPLITRDALAAWFVAKGLGAAWADAVLASGILRDPSTLADDIAAEASKYAVLRAAGFGLMVPTVSVAQLPDIIAAALSEATR